MLPILQTGHPLLRQKASPLSHSEILSASIQELIQTMTATMHKAPGVGLAAPQIGESLQLIVIEDRAEYMQHIPKTLLNLQERKPIPFHVIINPEIILVETEEKKAFFEGCLSIAGFVGLVPRALKVKVNCLNENAEEMTIEASGWYARILQHEIDHLQGKLCIERASRRSWMTTENFLKYWREKPIDDIRREFPPEIS